MYVFVIARSMPFHDFTSFVILSPFTAAAGSSNADRNYFACVGCTNREEREDKK